MRADIAVVGAGPSGATVARLLAANGRDVLLVDAGERSDGRLEMLAPMAGAYGETIGLGKVLADTEIGRPCFGIRRIWGTGVEMCEEFIGKPGGRGVVVDRHRFDAALLRLATEAGAWLRRGRVTGVALREGGITLRIDAQERIEARTVIDATGRASAVSRRLHAGRMVLERRIASRRDAPPPQAAGWLEIHGDGGLWSYALDGPGDRREKWQVSPTPVAARHPGTNHNATTCILNEAGSDAWIAVGDAAAAFDPLTSQGLFTALSTAAVAAGIVLSAGGLTAEKARLYSNAIHATFWATEWERAAQYRAIGSATRVT